ncbi:MAG: TIGR02147 family protein [Bdellovibrionaceae bacterium]|nr:TIGR02147 family protein [Bdellovibrio sp.]
MILLLISLLMINNKIITENKASIFEYLKYVDYLKASIQNNAATYGYKAQIAEASNCQRSHLSLVLKGKAHFSIEQAISLADFFELDYKSKNYFLLLVQYARAGTQKLKLFVKTQIEEHLKAQENLSQRIVDKTVLPEEKSTIVYSSWEPLAIIISLSLPNIKTSAALAGRLRIKKEQVEKILNQLKEIGLTENHGADWRATEKTFHVPKTSRFNSVNHSNWRQKAVQNSFLQNEDVHYTSVCTLSKADAKKMKQMMLEFIDKSREVVAPSAEEEMFCLTCDWFQV